MNIKHAAVRLLNDYVLLGLFIAAMVLIMQMIVTPFAHGASDAEVRAGIGETLTDFREEVRGADQVISTAKGLLVFPSIYQAGFVIGGEYGKGGLKISNNIVDYYNIIEGSIGWQIGGQKKSMVVAFMTDDSLRKFRESSGWDIGGDAGVTLVTEGLEGQVTAATVKKPILVFVLDQKGLMGGVSLKGMKISKL